MLDLSVSKVDRARIFVDFDTIEKADIFQHVRRHTEFTLVLSQLWESLLQRLFTVFIMHFRYWLQSLANPAALPLNWGDGFQPK